MNDEGRKVPCAAAAALAVAAWAGAGALLPQAAIAQTLNGLATTGLLSVPDAKPIGVGTIAVGLSNSPEPQFGRQDTAHSYLLGVGLLPGLDVVGRIAEYQTRRADGFGLSGISDLGVNAKYSIGLFGDGGLRVAVGIQDLAGASAGPKFKAQYGVATLPWGRWEATLGAGRSQGRSEIPGTKLALDGAFGGLSYRVALPSAEGPSPLAALGRLGGQLTLHAEFDARQPLVGARWTSEPIAALANGRFSAGLHHAFENGARNPAATVMTVSLAVPFGANERGRGRGAVGVAGAADAASTVSAAGAAGAASATSASAAADAPLARLGRLKEALVAQGLERVRVGRVGTAGWVVEYQNRRFARNEMDALGVVTGLAARAAPEAVQQLVVVVLRQEQPVLTLRTEPAAWRNFLETGFTAALQDVTRVQRGGVSWAGAGGGAVSGAGAEPAASAARVDWLSDEPSAATRVQLQLSPELNYAVATEFGFFDYSLAGRVRATVPLQQLVPQLKGWNGLQLVATAQGRLASSAQAEPGGAFPDLQHPDGLQVLALQQTYWLGRRAVLSGTVGRFDYGSFGAEGEAVVFVPGRDDVIRLRGRVLDQTRGMPRGFDQAGGFSYRWVGAPGLWAEAGWQRYTDGAQGPSFALSRWWGDIGVQMYYRRGEYQGARARQFVGFDFIFPLTPRETRALGPVHVEGKPFYRQGLRTMVSNTSNFVAPRAVRELQPAWDLDANLLNGGRLGPEYVMAQLGRMREAFLLFGGR